MPEQPLCQPLCLLQQRELFWVRLPSRQTPVWVWALPDRLHCPGGDSAGRSHWCRNIQIQKEEKVNKILNLNHFLFNMLLFFMTFEMFIFYHIFFQSHWSRDRVSAFWNTQLKWKSCIYFDNLHWNISFDIRLRPNLYIILSGLAVACMDLSPPTLDRLPATVMMMTKRVYSVCILKFFYFSWFKCFLAHVHQTFFSSTTFIICTWAIWLQTALYLRYRGLTLVRLATELLDKFSCTA